MVAPEAFFDHGDWEDADDCNVRNASVFAFAASCACLGVHGRHENIGASGVLKTLHSDRLVFDRTSAVASIAVHPLKAEAALLVGKYSKPHV